jgi:tRNA threonylcarbamoyladenosine biosynthesis protein TsaE
MADMHSRLMTKVSTAINTGATNTTTQWLADEAATVLAGQQLAAQLSAGMTVFLEGTLGAGKTTITRGILQGFGHSGAVKSPTYTLVEPYEQLLPMVYHFDLYRLGDPEELEYMGIRDYFTSRSLCIVEWAERGQGVLPEPDVVVSLVPKIFDGSYCDDSHNGSRNKASIVGRELSVTTKCHSG